MRRSIVRGVGLLALGAIAGCGPVLGGRIDDGTITTRVRTALLYDVELASLRLGVVTVDGVVTLSGTVRSDDQVSRAIQRARGVAGVRDVISTLTVVPQLLTSGPYIPIAWKPPST